ncbi:hypothetical protein [Chondromyces crocatus]|nr:hypothetical protein [Chondromyces crocatus]
MTGKRQVATPEAPTSARSTPLPDERARWRWVAAAALYGLTALVFFLSADQAKLTAHTPFNHFALLAQSWLEGRLDLGSEPPAYTGHNDFAVFDGKYFISFPPFPAVLLVPLVKLAGSAELVKDGRFFIVLAGLTPAVLFLALEKLAPRTRRTQVENAALSIFFALGSVYWFTAVQGTVWFAAHVVGALLACVYLYGAIDAAHPVLAGLALGLGFATRTPLGFALPFFLWEFHRVSRDRGDLVTRTTKLGLFAAPCVAILALLLWHNHARFGDPMEFGHTHLVTAWRPRVERWGLFSYHYLPRNLAVMLTSLPYTGVDGVPFQINVHGLALWVTTPLYAWALWPRRTSSLFWALAATAGPLALLDLLYHNSGWVQFGYRFSNDYAPFLFAMIAASGRRLRAPFYALGIVAIAINAFGALTFQRAGFERYYFLERTQRVLHQPD